jgi:hypothetical protein
MPSNRSWIGGRTMASRLQSKRVMWNRLLVLGLLAGCADEPREPDITGPFTGPEHRFVIDAIILPQNSLQARQHANDLDGDGDADNQIGMLTGTISTFELLTSHGPAMIGSGVIASSVVIRADDLAGDPTVSVTYYGADGAAATAVGGRIEDGVFRSNRTRYTRVPGMATLHLPVFVDADPSVVTLIGMELDLVPDGAGGYDGIVRGGLRPADALAATHAGLAQLIAAEPQGHRTMLDILDAPPRDWNVTLDEVRTSNLIGALFTPDLELFGGPALSLGIGVHLRPCPSGRCEDAAHAPSCFDRVRNGDETDVDCGGSCRACTTAQRCSIASDCDSGSCSGGTCGAPTCSDGVRNGFETDVDCGGPCGACELGARCWSNADCTSWQCGIPCTNTNPYNCKSSTEHDVCRAP